jgi:hypothetical protein
MWNVNKSKGRRDEKKEGRKENESYFIDSGAVCSDRKSRINCCLSCGWLYTPSNKWESCAFILRYFSTKGIRIRNVKCVRYVLVQCWPAIHCPYKLLRLPRVLLLTIIDSFFRLLLFFLIVFWVWNGYYRLFRGLLWWLQNPVWEQGRTPNYR